MFRKGKRVGALLDDYPEFSNEPALIRAVVEGLALSGIFEPETKANREIIPALQSQAKALKELESGQNPEITWKGLEALDAARSQAPGVVFAYLQPHTHPVLEKVSGPGDHHCRLAFRPGEEVSTHLDALERKEVLALPHVQNPNVGAALRGPLNKRLAAVSMDVANFALEHTLMICPLWVRLKAGKWEISVRPGVPPSGSAAGITMALQNVLGELITSEPEQWDWPRHPWRPMRQHLLWKRRGDQTVVPKGTSASEVLGYRILVKPPSDVREACFSIPAVRAIQSGRPDAQVTVLCPAEQRTLWEKVTEVRQIVETDAEPPKMDLGYQLGVLLDQEPKAFDVTAAFHCQRIVGFERSSYADALDDCTTALKGLRPPEHRSKFYLRIAHRIGADVQNDPSIFHFLNGLTSEPANPLVLGVVLDSDNGPAGEWPVEHFAKLMRDVSSEVPSVWRVIGTQRDPKRLVSLRDLADDVVMEDCTNQDIDGVLQVLSECYAVVGNESIATRLAALGGIPGVALFGPDTPVLSATFGDRMKDLHRHVECSPCFQSKCPVDHRCMAELAIDKVTAAFRDTAFQSRSAEKPKTGAGIE